MSIAALSVRAKSWTQCMWYIHTMNTAQQWNKLLAHITCWSSKTPWKVKEPRYRAIFIWHCRKKQRDNMHICHCQGWWQGRGLLPRCKRGLWVMEHSATVLVESYINLTFQRSSNCTQYWWSSIYVNYISRILSKGSLKYECFYYYNSCWS
jgi:hypothetical protein